MTEEKMSLIEELQNPPRVEDGHLDEDKTVDLMRSAAFALSTMSGVAAKAGGANPWQSIETAPVGKRLLFWWRPINNNIHAEACVTGSLPYPPTGQWWNEQIGKYQDIWHLTHWMELPWKPDANV